MIEIVGASRLSKQDFWTKSPLGLSLQRLAHDTRLTASIAFENRLGLPDVFNARIHAPTSQQILVFVHDDVWIDDFFLARTFPPGKRKSAARMKFLFAGWAATGYKPG